MALPVSAGYQARIDTANTGLAGLPGIFNPRRRSLAYETAAGLNESGLTSGLDVEQVDEGGNLVYRLVRGADGRLYSQAFRKVGEEHGRRGTFYSSFNERDQRDARRELDVQRSAAMRQFGSQQEGITGQQAEEDRRLRGELAAARGEYTDWRAIQPVPDPGAGAAAPGAPGAAPPGVLSVPAGLAPGPRPPRRAMGYDDFLRGRASTSALAHRWDTRFNYGRRFGGA